MDTETAQLMTTFRNSRGIALIATLSIVLVVGLLVLGSAVMGVIDRSAASNQYRSNAAYYLAMTGIDVMKTAIFQSLVQEYEDTQQGWCESPVEGSIGGIFFPDIWYEGKDDEGGSYKMRYQTFGSLLVVESQGDFGNATSRVRLVASSGPGPASAWDNAITAQGRPTEQAIAGNVSVYGSVQIVRGYIDGDPEGTLIDGSLDTTGTSGIYSDYFGTGVNNSDLRLKIENLVETDVDLCARVKIASGNIYAAGNVELGIDDPLERRQLYSIHLGDGVVCNRNRQSCNPSNPNHTVTDHNDSNRIWLRYPEDGLSLEYEPFELDLPRLNARAFDPASVLMIRQPIENDLTDPMNVCAWMYEGGVVRLPPADPTESHLGCAFGDNRIQWLPDSSESGGYLVIHGRVNITDANLDIPSELLYEGRGSLLVGDGTVGMENDEQVVVSLEPGDIYIGGSVRPRRANTYLREPPDEGDELALLATRDITFDVTAAEPASGVLLYANRDFVSQKQGIIVGAVVAEVFDMKQVPKIAYHPDVSLAACRLFLPGTACADEEGIPQSAGILSNIAIERY